MFYTWKCRATYGGFSSRTGKNVEFDENEDKINAIPNPTAAGIIELDKYLNEPLIHRTADPLLWWYQRKEVYPRLYEMAKRGLCIMATSVPCERVFSKTGPIISEKRNRLTSSKASEIWNNFIIV